MIKFSVTIKKISKKTIAIIAGIFSFILFLIIQKHNSDSKNEEIADLKKEVKKNELEKTDAADIVATSDNQSDIHSAITNEQSELRKRIRNRLQHNNNTGTN